MKKVKGKIVRIVEMKNIKRQNSKWFYIIETGENIQHEVIDYTSTKLYEIGDIILADNYHFARKHFQQSTIVKIVNEE